MSTAQQALRRHRADDALARDYGALRREVLASVRGQLKRRGVVMDDADLDAFYNQAWHGLYDQLLAGRDVRNPSGFLVVVCVRRAFDELRRLRPDGRAADADVAALGRDDEHAARMDDRLRLRQFVEGLRDRLTPRECQAATLCYLHDYTRPEAAALLGVEPKRMEKIMDGVSKKVAEFVRAIEAGRWCHERGSLMRAYAFGVLAEQGERRELAADHLAGCSGCRAYVRSLRGLSAALPPVALPLGAPGSPGAAGVLDRLRQLVDGAEASALRLVEDAPERAAAGVAVLGGGGVAAAGGASAGGGAAVAAGAAGGGLAAKLTAAVVALAVAGGGVAAVDGAGRPADAPRATAAPVARVMPAGPQGVGVVEAARAHRALEAARTIVTRRPAGGRRAAADRRRATRAVRRAPAPSTTPPAPAMTAPASTAPATAATAAPVTVAPAPAAPAAPAAPPARGEFGFESG